MRMAARLLAALLVAAVLASAALAATDPRSEQRRLRPADVALAKRTNLRLSELARGWVRYTAPKSGSTTRCPGYSPDLSRFTITGEAQASFRHPSGFAISSAVQVYPSRAQAVADFKAGAKPGLTRCLARLFETDFARGAGGRGTTLSSRMVASPRLGERAAWYRLIGRLTVHGVTARVYMDVLAFQARRSQAALVSAGLGGPIRDQVALGRMLAARMR
jgi:hypothetical protein